MQKTQSMNTLDRLGINYRLFTHPGEVISLEQAAMERNQAENQVIRSILFRFDRNSFVMALISGAQQISWSALRNYIGIKRITMATDEEVFSVTGSIPGAVTPIGVSGLSKIIADPGILEPDEVSIGSGVRGTTIILKSKDLIRAVPQLVFVKLT